MDIGSITATISGLKAAGDIVNSILELKTSDSINTAVREANSHLLSVQREMLAAQSNQLAMIEEIRTLKEKIIHMEAWETEKQRYKLTSPWNTGSVVYALKESMKESEPPHYICTNCYENGRKSILNPYIPNSSFVSYGCPVCKAEKRTGVRGKPKPEYTTD